ncbi:MAG TPA: efflux RND transporter permease subunit [Spirochaetota bacterium]|nr:efflux RND transporter permease subunit [Spirochaetota bacterium]
MIRYFLENRVSAFIVLMAFVIAGVISIRKLPVSLLPSSDYPALSVIIEYPGISPDKMESLITRPVERILKTVNGITEMQSVSEEGKSRVNLTFADNINIRFAAINVREKIDLIRDSFPREVQEPVVMRYDPSDRPVIVAAIEIDGLGCSGVREYAERRIKPALQRIDGVSEINIAGGDIKEIHIEAYRSSLEARGLSIRDIGSIVRRGNLSLPCGIIETAKGNMILYVPARFRNAGDIGDLMVSGSDNRPVYIRDIAVISYAPREREDLSRYNGKEMVTLYIHKGGGANTINICDEAGDTLSSFREAKVTTIYDQGDYVSASINNASFSGIWGLIIAVLVLAIFYRRKENIVPVALTIPASIMAVPAFLYFGGRGINVMSLSGFALCAGLVVSNGIMIMESINARGGGEDIVPGAVSSMTGAVVSSTLTNIAVFLPLVAMSKKAGSTYGDMAYTVVWSLLVSLFAALVLVPSFYVSLKKPGTGEGIQKSMPALLKHTLYTAGGRIREWESLITRRYTVLLDYSLKQRGRIALLTGTIFFISLIIFSVIKTDSFSDRGSGEFYAYLEFPTGLSLEATDMGVAAVEEIVKGIEGVKSVSSKIEKWRGTLTVKPAAGTGEKGIERIKEDIRSAGGALLREYNGFIYMSEADEIASREISIHFIGDDTDILKGIARDAASKIKAVSGIEECLLRFRDGRPEYLLTVDRERAAAGLVDHASIAERTRNSLFGPVVTKFIDEEREVDVRARVKESDRSTVKDLLAGAIINEKGESVSFADMVHLSEGEGITRMYRLNGRRSVSVTAKIGSLSFQDGEERIKSILGSMVLPDEYSWEFDRGLKEFMKERRALASATALSVLLIYMILASQFESYRLPLLIMITIPLAAAGIAPVLLLTFTPLSPPVYLGIIVLCGIVVNNGIILTDAVNKKIDGRDVNDIDVREIIRSVSIEKFRPVVITTVITILGLAPMLINSGEGSSLWRPFALTVIAGLFFSSILTLIIVPVFSIKFFRSVRDRGDKI